MLRIQRKKEKKCIKCFVTTQLNLITGRGRILNSNNLSSEKRQQVKTKYKNTIQNGKYAYTVGCRNIL